MAGELGRVMHECAETKTCTRCKQTKPLTDQFWQPRPEKPVGWYAECRDCRNVRSQKHRDKPESFFQRQAVNMASRFKITVTAAKYWIRRRENSVCEICGSGIRKAVDHHHGDGHIRGILCGNCNKGIGALGDNPDILRRALMYLEKHGAAKLRPCLAC